MSLVGKKAPVFNAPAVINGDEIVESFSLEQYVGQKEVIFFFYPKDFTFVCPTEIILSCLTIIQPTDGLVPVSPSLDLAKSKARSI